MNCSYLEKMREDRAVADTVGKHSHTDAIVGMIHMMMMKHLGDSSLGCHELRCAESSEYPDCDQGAESGF